MGRFYNDEDLTRWEKSYRESVCLIREKLVTDLPQQKIDFYLNMLSLSHESQGMISIARGRFQEAIEAFAESTEVKCKQYEQFAAGKGRALEAGTYQSILIAFVTKDDKLISKLVTHYRAEDGTPDSIFLGRALKLLATNDSEAALDSLKQKRPRFERQFIGYAECLEAIANKDQPGFVAALEVASTSWAKVVSKRDRGLPYAVCFVQGAGLVRLAERVLKISVLVANEHIPQQLLH